MKPSVALLPSSSIDRFRFQPDRIRVGEVARYVKSNLDGSKPARVSIFVAAPDRTEVADWKSFRLELEGIETMTPEGWKKFIAGTLAKANAEG